MRYLVKYKHESLYTDYALRDCEFRTRKYLLNLKKSFKSKK